MNYKKGDEYVDKKHVFIFYQLLFRSQNKIYRSIAQVDDDWCAPNFHCAFCSAHFVLLILFCASDLFSDNQNHITSLKNAGWFLVFRTITAFWWIEIVGLVQVYLRGRWQAGEKNIKGSNINDTVILSQAALRVAAESCLV